MKHFRALTEGEVVIMGRRTMESLPGKRPLVNRQNIVLSRQLEGAEGFLICHSLPDLWRVLGRLCAEKPAAETLVHWWGRALSRTAALCA